MKSNIAAEKDFTLDYFNPNNEDKIEIQTDVKKIEVLNSQSVSHRIGIIFQKICLIFICIIGIVIIWSSFILVVAFSFEFTREAATNLNSQNTNLSKSGNLPVMKIHLDLDTANGQPKDEFVFFSDLVVANSSNANELTGNFTIENYNRYISRNVTLYFYPPLVTEPPRIVSGPPGFVFIFDSINTSIINSNISFPVFLHSYTSNLFESLNLTVHCPNEYTYENSVCTLPLPYCDQWHLAGQVGNTVLRAGLIILTVFGFIVSVFSLITFLLGLCFIRDEKTPTLFNQLFETLLSPSIFTLYIFASLCILLFFVFDLPNPNQTYCIPSSQENVGFNLYGAIFHFSFMGYFFWVNLTLFNLLLMISFPMAFYSNMRLKIGIYAIEVIISLFITLLLVSITFITRNTYYGIPYVHIVVPGIRSVITIALYFLPLFLFSVSILTLTPILLSKLRWNSFRVKRSGENPFKVSSLQIRIIIYSMVLFVILFVLQFGLLFSIRIFFYPQVIRDTNGPLCTTLHSPSTINDSGRIIHFESVTAALKKGHNISEAPYALNSACEGFEARNELYPPEMYIYKVF